VVLPWQFFNIVECLHPSEDGEALPFACQVNRVTTSRTHGSILPIRSSQHERRCVPLNICRIARLERLIALASSLGAVNLPRSGAVPNRLKRILQGQDGNPTIRQFFANLNSAAGGCSGSDFTDVSFPPIVRGRNRAFVPTRLTPS
jgi:hypothetical protein